MSPPFDVRAESARWPSRGAGAGAGAGTVLCAGCVLCCAVLIRIPRPQVGLGSGSDFFAKALWVGALWEKTV